MELTLQCPNCNVIFLNIELLRPEFVGLLGNSSLTPNIDRFFSKSIIFHDVTAPAGETFLSNTAVLTVTPSHRINIRPIIMDSFNKQDKETQQKIKHQLTVFTSVATILKKAEYRTISINQGGRAGKAVFLDRDFDDFSQWSSDLVFEDMIDILKDRLTKVGDKKFFLLFRPTYLHNHQYRRPVNSKTKIPVNARQRNYSYQDGIGSQKEGVLLKRDRKQSEEINRQVEREIYTGQVKYGDTVIKKLFDSLNDDLLNNTIIVLYANHGTGLGDNKIYNHGTAYQSSVSVPLLIRMPGMMQAIHVRESVALISLVPSILRMLNIKPESNLSNETYDQVIAGRASKNRVFYGQNGFDEFIRFNNWKYIVQYGRFEKLYNLELDPGETSDLIEKEQMMSRKLAALLLQYKSRLLRDKIQQESE
jgi:arylsulfatase A-like enzyme